MAKISSYTTATPAAADKLLGTDVSDTGNDAGGETVNFTLSGIASWMASLTQTLTNKTLTSPRVNVGDDAAGDLLYRAATGLLTRLGVGSNGQVLTLAAGVPTWAAAAAATDWTDVTPVATTSGTSIEFTSLPSGLTEIELWYDEVSITAATSHLVQVSTGGSFVTSGYASGSNISGSVITRTDGFAVFGNASNFEYCGVMRLHRATGNLWLAEHAFGVANVGWGVVGGGRVSLGGTLDGIRLNRISGDFDNGQVKLRYK